MANGNNHLLAFLQTPVAIDDQTTGYTLRVNVHLDVGLGSTALDRVRKRKQATSFRLIALFVPV